jgi:lipopolysaccharide export system protein LptA
MQSFPSPVAVVPVLAALALACALAQGAAAADRRDLPITVEADSTDFDYRNSVLVFRNVRITQGDALVEAAQATATGLDFENSRWRFEGRVRITVEDGTLESDTATVRFVNNEIEGADVAGRPARFRQQRDSQLAEGRAGRIDYDLGSQQVRLTGDAWLSDGRNEITGSRLVYGMREQRVLAEASEQGGQPVRITINPRQAAEPPPPEPEPGPEPEPEPR